MRRFLSWLVLVAALGYLTGLGVYRATHDSTAPDTTTVVDPSKVA